MPTRRKFYVTLTDGHEEETRQVTSTLAELPHKAELVLYDWILDGGWEDEGTIVQGQWIARLADEIVAEGSLDVDLKPDDSALIRQAGGNPYCDHLWIDSGSVSLGGTTLVHESHCSICRLIRSETCYGSQRNPEQADKVRYSMPDYDT